MRPKDDAKVEAIYEATLRQIDEVGIAGATMARIARDAGVATGTLYTYFENKHELLSKLYVRIKSGAVAEFVRDMPADQPYRIVFRRVWLNMLQFNVQRHLEGTFMAQFYRSTYISEEVRAEGLRLFQPINALLDRGKREQLVRDVDNALLHAAISGPIYETAQLVHEGRLTLNDEIIEQVFQMTWDSIKA